MAKREKLPRKTKEFIEKMIEEAPEIRPGFSDSLGSVPYFTVKTKDGRTKYIPKRLIVYID